MVSTNSRQLRVNSSGTRQIRSGPYRRSSLRPQNHLVRHALVPKGRASGRDCHHRYSYGGHASARRLTMRVLRSHKGAVPSNVHRCQLREGRRSENDTCRQPMYDLRALFTLFRLSSRTGCLLFRGSSDGGTTSGDVPTSRATTYYPVPI